MICTLTLNPAIDYLIFLDKLSIGKINRSYSERLFFGGKGINVSLVLSELGIKSVATGFVAGFTGDVLEKGISNDNITSDFVKLENGYTRINIKIRDCKETDINASGPIADSEHIEKLLKKLEKLNSGDILVISGSVPSTLPNNIYETILESLNGKGIKFIIDAEKQLLLDTLKYKPFLIKPNLDELSDIFGLEIKTHKQVLKYASKLQGMGAENVLVSMGEKGAVLLDEKQTPHLSLAHQGKTINTVGAGDSMLAGFIAGYINTKSFDYALKLGIASGSATAFNEGLAQKQQIINLLNTTTEN